MPYQSLGSWRMSAGNDSQVSKETYLWIWEVIEGLLISAVCLMKVVDHKIAVSYSLELAGKT
jgi:hypothetical protein